MAASGECPYAVLGLEKDCTQEDIKRAYKRMALQYHPDKNQNSPEATEKFQQINYANSVLSDETKKSIYDKYGFVGLRMADQIGEDNVKTYMLLSSCWCKALMMAVFCLTGCCCCLCCCLCCNCCCGKCSPDDDDEDEFEVPPDFDTNESASNNAAFYTSDEQADQPGVFNISGTAVNDHTVTSQPIGVTSTAGHTDSSTPIVLGYKS